MTPNDDLRRTNIDIGRAEKEQDVTDLETFLHDRLVFRRASAKIVGKREYLDAAAKTTYSVLEVTDVEKVSETNEVAVWTVNVKAKGLTPERKQFSGVFQNVRIFVHENGRWQLLAWANTKIGELKE